VASTSRAIAHCGGCIACAPSSLASAAPGDSGTAFGIGGKSQVDFGGRDLGWAVALQPDGKIVVAGYSTAGGNGANSLNFAVARLQGDPGGLGGPSRCAGKKATVVGTVKRDKLIGTKKRDVIAALGARDTVKSGKGDDIVCAGPGKDKVVGAPARTSCWARRGKDKLVGGRGKDRLIGGPGKDACVGRPGKDVEKSC
jgi:Ca2+-binding RTX toxin-like protein